jgi:glycosyltransferase involved in cell wall biosynthesis
MTHFPLVSCIMPTNNRRPFAIRAIRYFIEQNYPNKELIIIDDGSDQIADLVPDNAPIKYIGLDRKTSVGNKRNLAVEDSRADIILHWDDDDWYARYRIRYQVENLLKHQTEICGINRLLFFELRTRQLWLYEYPSQRKIWLAGGALCYRKSFWQHNRFADVSIGEDTRFVMNTDLSNALILPDFKFYLAMIHTQNTSPKSPKPPFWKQWKLDELQNLLKDDWAFYENMENPRVLQWRV